MIKKLKMSFKIDSKAVVQKVPLSDDSLKFQVPFAMSVTGPSQSGKSEFICKLIQNSDHVFSTRFHRIIYCQPEILLNRDNHIFSKIKTEFPSAELHFGLPKISELYLDLNSLPCLLIIDDLMTDLLNSAQMVELFSVQVHHYNISVIFTLQNFFAASRYGKSISQNVHYKVFFYNRLDLVELRHISLQINPNSPNFLATCFQFLENRFPHVKYKHYIVIDGHAKSLISQFYVRTNIFPDYNNEITPIIFFPH
jgi:hypothetical protein